MNTVFFYEKSAKPIDKSIGGRYNRTRIRIILVLETEEVH